MDIVCYYADLGRNYEPLIARMTASAKRVMPDARLVLLTPTPETTVGKHFDSVCTLPCKTDFGNLCMERARAMVSWMVATNDRAIFCDPDVEFRRPVAFDGTFDVGLLWRGHKPDQPINTGLILAEPGRGAFWKHYGTVCVNLPDTIHYWWCDQLAFALLTGVCRRPDERLLIDDARVWLMEANRYCSVPKHAHADAWAHHFKGALKGDEWSTVFPKKLKSGVGNSSPEFVS